MNIIKAIRDKLAGVDEVVPVLVLFEMIYLGVGMLIIWAFLPVDKPKVALGFAIGVGFSVLSSIQNSMILKRALSRGKKKSASAGMVIFMLARIAGISLIVILALKYEFCSAVAVLVGVLAIQAGVYFEPAIRKRRERKQAALRRTGRTDETEDRTLSRSAGGMENSPMSRPAGETENLSLSREASAVPEDGYLPPPEQDIRSQDSNNEEEL